MMFEPNRLINSKPLSMYPNLCDKVQCQICCLVFTDRHRPMWACTNKHTVCITCLQSIVGKSLKTPESPASCPKCRQRIQLPLQLNEQFTQFLRFLNNVQTLQQAINMQTSQIRQKSARIMNLQKEVAKKNQQIFQLKRRNGLAQVQLDKCKKQIFDLRNGQTKQQTRKGSLFESDSEFDTRMEEKPQRQPIRDIEIDKKPPLNQLFEQMVNDTYLSLAKKQFSKIQLQFLVMHDMSKLVQLNLSFNILGNQGLKYFCQYAQIPNLKILRLISNQISQLPDMKPLTNLEVLDMSNYTSQTKMKANRIRAEGIQKLLAYKWQFLNVLGVQFDTDMIWDNEATLDRVVEQWPLIRNIDVSQVYTKITKKKCEAATKILNNKAKRPNHNRIRIGVQNI